MKNSADFGGCNPPRPSVSVDKTLHYLENSSYPTRPHSIIANSLLGFKTVKWSSKVRVSLKLTCLYSPLLQAYYHPQLYTFSLECFQGKSCSKQRSLSLILSAILKSVISIISFNLLPSKILDQNLTLIQIISSPSQYFKRVVVGTHFESVAPKDLSFKIK